jgi:hypothetical protein
VVIGAPFDSNDNVMAGSVFVYKETSTDNWELVGDKIIPADGLANDAFGFSVDIDEDNNIVVGSRVRYGCLSISSFSPFNIRSSNRTSAIECEGRWKQRRGRSIHLLNSR